MKWSKWYLVFTIAIIASMLLGACATPTPKVVEKVVTKEVRVTMEKVVTKEVEKVVTKEAEKIVVATPTPEPGEDKKNGEYASEAFFCIGGKFHDMIMVIIK